MSLQVPGSNDSCCKDMTQQINLKILFNSKKDLLKDNIKNVTLLVLNSVLIFLFDVFL